MIRQEITITNELGLHARPAAEFVRAAKAFRSQIWIVKGEERFSAASILEVLTANLYRGDTATIEAERADAEQAVKSLGPRVVIAVPGGREENTELLKLPFDENNHCRSSRFAHRGTAPRDQGFSIFHDLASKAHQ